MGSGMVKGSLGCCFWPMLACRPLGQPPPHPEPRSAVNVTVTLFLVCGVGTRVKQPHLWGICIANCGLSHNGKAVFRDPEPQETSEVPRITEREMSWAPQGT